MPDREPIPVVADKLVNSPVFKEQMRSVVTKVQATQAAASRAMAALTASEHWQDLIRQWQRQHSVCHVIASRMLEEPLRCIQLIAEMGTGGRYDLDVVTDVLCERYGWTPEQIDKLTFPELLRCLRGMHKRTGQPIGYVAPDDTENLSRLLAELIAENAAPRSRQDSEPDTTGYVPRPPDPRAYVAQKTIREDRQPSDVSLTARQVTTILQDYVVNQIRWTRPIGKNGAVIANRCNIHLVDWIAYIERRKGGRGENDQGDPTPEQIDARKASTSTGRMAARLSTLNSLS